MEYIITLKKENIIAAQKKFGGKNRADLKDSDFLYPDTRSFPIRSVQDVRDAISNFGRSNSGDSYETFIKKLWSKAKSLGFEAGVPESTRKEHNLK